ncbi:MAG: uncharacterized protein KVP18_001977 [Porospora cf. gigantea A]|uniref:uncharacterized protein n=2 Tax=Porospora cf. gigantea A TaxID=2853593 RepID=UPI00355A9974|nr:MAG: hypothetical protein KVP18_001977 [Porospora cf. gigantea A]
MAPCYEHNASVAHPLIEESGEVTGFFNFPDEYLSPSVLYGNYPPTTTIKLGGRTLEMDRLVTVKIRLLEESEDRRFWCNKKQHSERLNCGDFHRDFGDAEVAYSFSSPQTHVWFAGYSIHCDHFENLSFHSHNTSIRVRPEHLIPRALAPMPSTHPNLAVTTKAQRVRQDRMQGRKSGKRQHATDFLTQPPRIQPLYSEPSPNDKGVYGMVIDNGYSYPMYSAMVPKAAETYKGLRFEYEYTPEHLNDCERPIWKRDEFNVGANISQISQPVSVPPVYPPLMPYEHPNLVWSSNVEGPLRQIRQQIDALENLADEMAGRGGTLKLAKPHRKIRSKQRPWVASQPPRMADPHDMLDKRSKKREKAQRKEARSRREHEWRMEQEMLQRRQSEKEAAYRALTKLGASHSTRECEDCARGYHSHTTVTPMSYPARA